MAGGRTKGYKNGRAGKAAKVAKNAPKLKPEGEKDGCMRTPKNSFDMYKGRPSYSVTALVLKRLHRGVPEYNVQWVGIPSDGNTWEPVEHLQGPDGKNAIKCFEEAQRLLLIQVRLLLARGCLCPASDLPFCPSSPPPPPPRVPMNPISIEPTIPLVCF